MPAGDVASVLIVDDQQENLLALAAVLEPLGHRIVEASSGEEALKRLLEDDFDLIVLDVQMPGLDGFETAEFVKRRERTRHVPIIFLTAIDKEAHHVFRGYEVGAVDYVVKPFDPEVLRSKVSVFVDLHRTSVALRESEERFRTAFSAAPIGIGLLGADGRFSQVNQALCDLVDRSQADLIDAPLGRLFPGLTASALDDLLDRVLTVKLRGLHEERRLQRGDGREVEVLLSMSATMAEDGRPASFIVQVADMTERAARRQAEAVADTVRKLQAVVDVALAHLAVDDLVGELVEKICAVFDADWAKVALREGADGALVPAAGAGDTAPAPETPRISAPLLLEGELRGMVHVGRDDRRPFTPEEEGLLQLVADRAALAIEHARLYERELGVAETLQRSLLPEQLPRIPGVELAARYLPGGQVGGDWYDAIPLDDGRIGLAMGDVVGQGLPAASVMGALRNSLRAYALEGHGPAAILERLDGLVNLERDGMATLVYIEIEPDLTSMRLASAGHLPPLVIGPDAQASYLPAHGSVPLGVGEAGYEDTVFELEPGSRLVLFTDGLVEERGESIEIGLERLRRAVTDRHDDPEALCDRLLAVLGRENGKDDDVTLLAVGTVPVAPEPLRLVLPADPSALAGMRRRLGRWLEELGAEEDERYEIAVACTEACGNSMEHGCSFGDSSLELEASRNGDGVVIVVRDEGGWREPQDNERGRGLLLMRGLMGSVELDARPDGTSVELRRSLAALSATGATVG